MRNKFLSMLGLAQRAGKLASGEETVLQAIQTGQSASRDLCCGCVGEYRQEIYRTNVDIINSAYTRLVDRQALGQAIGKNGAGRSSP